VALIEFVEVTLPPFDEARLWGRHLDYPRSGSIAEAAAVDIRGWVVGRHLSAVAIEIVDGDRVIRRVPVDVRRDDVARVYPARPDAHVSGFGTTLRMRPAEERHLKVLAVLEDHTRLLLAALRARTRWWGDEPGQPPRVSVIIPCYRQAHYLAEAIESVLVQTHPHLEVVVIDDGSPDNTAEIAGRYPGVRCLRQANRGVAEARNLGIRSSNGSFLVFLDADDRLLPRALEMGLDCFARHPEVAFVSGRFRFIAADGATLYDRQGHGVQSDHYAEMLRRNYIAALCATMCRRSVFESLVGFNPRFSIAADYDLYLRVLREFPAQTHDGEVAEYRRHGLGISADCGEMLREALSALRAQRPHLSRDPNLIRAHRDGIHYWKTLVAELMARQIRADWYDGRLRSALAGLVGLRRCGLVGFAPLVRRGHAGISA
jgi:glycosyltransferase involved in cell wall biosynthesis